MCFFSKKWIHMNTNDSNVVSPAIGFAKRSNLCDVLKRKTRVVNTNQHWEHNDVNTFCKNSGCGCSSQRMTWARHHYTTHVGETCHKQHNDRVREKWCTSVRYAAPCLDTTPYVAPDDEYNTTRSSTLASCNAYTHKHTHMVLNNSCLVNTQPPTMLGRRAFFKISASEQPLGSLK